jgi:SAM-dependent methyltransferase
VLAATREWELQRYFDGDPSQINEYFTENCVVLDAGCGAGLSAQVLFGERLDKINYLGVDISNAVDVAYKRLHKHFPHARNMVFMQSDLTGLPFNGPVFDVIFSEGVLHHTDSVQGSIQNLSRFLKPNGYFMFYIYKKKPPVREYCDDFIRGCISGMSDREAWEAMKPLTLLGKALGELNAEIDIPADIPFLGIKKGKMDVQRFFYWHIMKAYYRPEYSPDEMNHVNFDWYRPVNCHRHTPEEAETFCKNSGLGILRLYVDEAGITVIACKGQYAKEH